MNHKIWKILLRNKKVKGLKRIPRRTWSWVAFPKDLQWSNDGSTGNPRKPTSLEALVKLRRCKPNTQNLQVTQKFENHNKPKQISLKN